MCVCVRTGEKQCVHRNERVSANCLRKRKLAKKKKEKEKKSREEKLREILK